MGKSRKKGWKKISRAVDEELPEIHEEQRRQKIPDHELFVIDDVGEEPEEKLTVKQKRLRAHRERLSKLEDSKDNKKPLKLIQKREKISLPSRLERAKNQRTRRIPPTGVKANLMEDPWADEDTPMEGDFLDEGKLHDLKTRKKLKVKEPKTRKYVPSALPAVKVADPGASYNPEMNDYMEYANKLAAEEITREKAEQKLDRQLATRIKLITPEEQQAELEEGFFDETSDEEDEEDVKPDLEDVKPELLGLKKQPKPKSDKQKKRELRRKIAELEKKAEKQSTKKERDQLVNIKKLYKEIEQKSAASAEKAVERATNKLLNKLTKRKKLGRGQFEQYEEPISLPSEIKGSLRLAKTEGSLVSEHFKSLQSRNMLAVAGENDVKKLPKRLKRKMVAKYGVDKVTATSTRH